MYCLPALSVKLACLVTELYNPGTMLHPASISRLLLLLLATTPVWAQSTEGLWRLCPNTGLMPQLSAPPVLPANGEIFVSADTIESQDNEVSILSGNVEIHTELETIHADQATFNQGLQELFLKGNVHYRSDQLEVNADSMTTEMNSSSGQINQPDFYLPDTHASGTARLIERKSDDVTLLHSTTFTTCEPDKRSWYFSSSRLKLKHDEGMGIAKHMALRLKGVPIFYFPIVSFPIDDQRKSGFLFPTMGNSDRHGFELEIPWYWNIAPQADATLTAHNMSDRGLKMNTEWRYLNSWSKNTLQYDYLEDDIFEDTRTLLAIEHSGSFGRYWSTSLRGADVSDTDYLTDFGDNLSDISRSHIRRTATLTGQWSHWRLENKFESYQTVDDSIPDRSRPYRLLPDISLSGLYSNIGAGFEFELDSAYTVFDRKERINSKRFDFWPHISRPFGGSSWFITPTISSRYTSYELDFPEDFITPATVDAPEDKLNRTVPTGSLDTGLIFERTTGSENQYLQTFEPRLFYLYVPFREQDDIPIFDTSLPDFGFYQLFEENRFVGTDRMGDTEQLSFALSSRWLKRQSGEQLLRISLGQIHYRRDRLVTLRPRDEPETKEKSGVLANLEARLSQNWSTSLDVEWNPETEKTDKELFRLRYNRQNRYVFNLGYRFRQDSESTTDDKIEQSDISFVLPVGSKWSFIGRWNYSIEDELDLEKFVGFEYESCCWAFRLLARKFLIDGDDDTTLPATMEPEFEFDEGIYFEISFKGLASAGNGLGRRLQESIIGYHDPFE